MSMNLPVMAHPRYLKADDLLGEKQKIDLMP